MAKVRTGEELRVLTGTSDQAKDLILMPDEMFHAVDNGARYVGAGQGGRARSLVMAEMNPDGVNRIFAGDIDITPSASSQALDDGYSTATISSTSTVVRGACMLGSINVTASASGVITIYDNISAAGAVIFAGSVTAGQQIQLPADHPCYLGIHIVINSGTCTLQVQHRAFSDASGIDYSAASSDSLFGKSPGRLHGIVCTASSSGNINVLDGDSPSGVSLTSGAVSAGEIRRFSPPLAFANGLYFDLVSGTANINIYYDRVA